MEELWAPRFNRNAIAILNTALVYYQKPTFPTLHRHDYHDNKAYLTQFELGKKPTKPSLPDLKEANEYATSKIAVE